MDIQSQLANAYNTQHQKTRTAAYLALLTTLLAAPETTTLVQFGTHFTTSTSIPVVVGRRVLNAFLTAIVAGTTVEQKGTAHIPLDEDGLADKPVWEELGKKAWEGEDGYAVRRDVVQGILSQSLSGWCDEQTTVLRHVQSHLLTLEEDYEGAARALTPIQLESSSRLISDQDKLAVYMQITRLFLECGEWGLAQTYFTRASLLPVPEDKETRLAMRLSQARLFDFSGQFLKAAGVYHDLSLDTSIDPSDRTQILSAAVTTSILAPSGPQRSRILGNLFRDDRIHTELPAVLSTMLRKMLLEYIVKPDEVQGFESGLAEHQRAVVEGGGTVLERAVREHNVGACAKVYNNISFQSLASILSLPPSQAESTARIMIAQHRLRGYIDQPTRLLFFTPVSPLSSSDAQGTAGGLGTGGETEESKESEVEKGSWGERWDERIRDVGERVEEIAEEVVRRGLIVV